MSSTHCCIIFCTQKWVSSGNDFYEKCNNKKCRLSNSVLRYNKIMILACWLLLTLYIFTQDSLYVDSFLYIQPYQVYERKSTQGMRLVDQNYPQPSRFKSRIRKLIVSSKRMQPSRKAFEAENVNEKTLWSIRIPFFHWIGNAAIIFSVMFGCISSTFASAEIIRPTHPNSNAQNLITINSNTNDSENTVTSAVRNINTAQRYWSIQTDGSDDDRRNANRALMEHIVGTINTMYYDQTAGVQFQPAEYYNKWRTWYKNDPKAIQMLSSRDGTVAAIRNVLIQQNLPDRFAKYLTREELYSELLIRNDGFVGIGAIVEVPGTNPFLEDPTSINTNNEAIPLSDNTIPFQKKSSRWKVTDSLSFLRYKTTESKKNTNMQSLYYISPQSIQNVPIITAVIPFSPAERAGLTVGDRIIAVQDDSFLMLSRNQVATKLQERYSPEKNQYFGYSDITVAKPVQLTATANNKRHSKGSKTKNRIATNSPIPNGDFWKRNEEEFPVVEAFRPIRVRLQTVAAAAASESIEYNSRQQKQQQEQSSSGFKNNVVMISQSSLESPDQVNVAYVSGGNNNVVRWSKLDRYKGSIFFDELTNDNGNRIKERVTDEIQKQVLVSNENTHDGTSSRSSRNSKSIANDVGYIRLTRFSRTSAEGFFQAIKELEELNTQSYIIDLRNNYGGVIQYSMILASSLLRDPHDVLCYTMNNRGGFTPHDVEEYVVDKHYPGYLLSTEPIDATINQVRQENPSFLQDDGWIAPSSYASLREQSLKRGLHTSVRFSSHHYNDGNRYDDDDSFLSSTSPIVISTDKEVVSVQDMMRMKQKQAQKPIVLLVNEGTASAAEIFASALHDNGRIVALVGAKTYGKGLIQHTFPLPDGGALRLTVAEYLTPALQHVSRIGRAQYDPITGNWIGGGVHPDSTCDSKHGIPNNIGADLCVATALDLLKEYEQKQQQQQDHQHQQHQQIHRTETITSVSHESDSSIVSPTTVATSSKSTSSNNDYTCNAVGELQNVAIF